ncbi:MAG TPA: S9 family peptidase [Steroidobacteraceae bacterium]|nr:S9 family peptidase [Steroidobacteraceae bacterium]
MKPSPDCLSRILCMGSLTVLAATSHAQGALTPAQALDYWRIADLHLSPDAKQLAYLVLSYSQDYTPHLCVMDLVTRAVRELTPGRKSERLPQWSPDGHALAFLSNRAGKSQLFLLAGAQSEPSALTDRKFGVTSFHWSPDGKAIAYLAKDDSAASDDSGPQVADLESQLARLWIIDPATRQTRRLASDGYRIDEFQWQDAGHLLMVATAAPRIEAFNDALYAVSLADSSIQLVARPPQPFSGLLVSPDRKSIALRSTRANGPIARDLFLGTIGHAELRDISASVDRTVAEVRWPNRSQLWARVADGFYNRLYRFAQRRPGILVPLTLSVDSFDVSADGTLVFAGEDFTHLPEIWLRDRGGRLTQLTHMQQGVVASHLASAQIFRTAGFDGTQIEAALLKPVGTQAVPRAPLILLVHGGPSSNFTAGYGWEVAWGQLLANHGYAVLLANPRGSSGYSEDFLKANRGDWGGGDYRDLLAVLDAVIARGGVDADRLGIGGWSYGGEMSVWATTQTDRFKAAVAGASVFDQAAEFATESGPAGDEWYFGTPWEHPEVFARNSPSTYIRNAHTPTLILDGEDDTDNPVGQSKGLYRALKHFGIEAQLVLYPAEGHSPRLGANNVDMFQRILAWYDMHLKGAGPGQH